MKHLSLRLKDTSYQILIDLMEKLDVPKSDFFNQRVDLLLEKLAQRESTFVGVSSLPPLSKQAQQGETFDYEKWYCDCPYGTYLKDEKLVYCRCTYHSVVKWLPKNRKVMPQVCDDHYPKLQALEDWIERKRSGASPQILKEPEPTSEQDRELVYCALKSATQEEIPFYKLPCITGEERNCPNVKCLAEIKAGKRPQLTEETRRQRPRHKIEFPHT